MKPLLPKSQRSFGRSVPRLRFKLKLIISHDSLCVCYIRCSAILLHIRSIASSEVTMTRCSLGEKWILAENDGISVLLISSSYFPEHVASFGPLCHPGDFVLRAVRYQPSVLHMTEPQWLRDRRYLGQVFLCQGSVRVRVGGALSCKPRI